MSNSGTQYDKARFLQYDGFSLRLAAALAAQTKALQDMQELAAVYANLLEDYYAILKKSNEQEDRIADLEERAEAEVERLAQYAKDMEIHAEVLAADARDSADDLRVEMRYTDAERCDYRDSNANMEAEMADLRAENDALMSTVVALKTLVEFATRPGMPALLRPDCGRDLDDEFKCSNCGFDAMRDAVGATVGMDDEVGDE